MKKDEIIHRLKNILVEDLFVADSVDEIDIDSELGNELGLDSVGFVELGTLVGEIFNVQVTESDIATGHLTSVSRLTDFIYGRLTETVGA